MFRTRGIRDQRPQLVARPKARPRAQIAALLGLGLVAALAACTPAAPAGTATPVAVTDAASLEAALAAAGLEATLHSEPNLGYFGPQARIYSLGGEDTLEVHVYPDSGAAAEVAAGVSADGSTVTDPSGEKVAMAWMGSPHLYRLGPVLAIYVGSDRALLAALESVLGPPFAGAPDTRD